MKRLLLRDSLRVSIYLIVLSICLGGRAPSAMAQSLGTPGHVEVGASYDWTRANAPAGQCVCFSMNGGTGLVALNLTRTLGLVAEMGGNHASNLNGTSQSLTTYTYLGGARYAVPTRVRASLYGEALFGTTYEYSNYAFVDGKSAFTIEAGGGVHLPLSRRLGLNLVQIDWVHSTLPNGSNDRQNDLRIGTGLYLRFGTR